MDSQLKRNRNKIIIIFAMTIVPFCIAWVLSMNPDVLTSRTNRGELIIPVVVTQRTDITGFDQFSTDNIKELAGHWVILNVVPGQKCAEECLYAMYKTRQLRLMLNKDLTRTRRGVLILDKVDPLLAATWWGDDDRLLRLMPDQELINKLKNLDDAAEIDDGSLFLMDPLGNFMMRYKPGFDVYDIKKDLHKLLKISQIG
jgi:hypothetical protein